VRVGILGDGDSEPHSPSISGSGEHCKLPQRGPVQSPGKYEIWCNLRPQKSLQKCIIMYKSYQGLDGDPATEVVAFV